MSAEAQLLLPDLDQTLKVGILGPSLTGHSCLGSMQHLSSFLFQIFNHQFLDQNLFWSRNFFRPSFFFGLKIILDL